MPYDLLTVFVLGKSRGVGLSVLEKLKLGNKKSRGCQTLQLKKPEIVELSNQKKPRL